MAGDVTPYINLITSEHIDKPKYTAMVASTSQPFADLSAAYQAIPMLYDVDVAVGEQLDVVGQWVGITRYLDQAITGVYFAFDTLGLGFDQGVWQGPFDPVSGLVALPDEYYRILIKVKILNNQWNGSKVDAYAIINAIFAPYGYTFFIEDPSDLTMKLGLVGPGTPLPLLEALLTSGKFDIKPAGVRITSYLYQSVPGPLFAFDLTSSLFAGFDVGGWATIH